MAKLNLYELAEELEALDELVEMEDGEWTEEIETLALELTEKMTRKADSFAAYLKEIERLEEVAKDEERRLAKRRKTLGDRRERLKRYAVMAIRKTGRDKIAGDLRTLATQANARTLLVVGDPEKLPGEFVDVVPAVPERIIPAVPEHRVANEKKIVDALKEVEGKLDADGNPIEAVPGCVLAPTTYHLRIR